MQLVVEIDDSNLANKIIEILNVFKNDGLKIRKQDSQNIDDKVEYSDEYLEKNWREMVMTSGDNSNYYKSDEYYIDRADDYQKREKI
jgi:hypothetical protein